MNEETSMRNGIGAAVSDPACFVGSAILHSPSSIFAFMLAGRRCRIASFYPMPARGLRCNRPAQTQNSDSGNIWSDLVTLSHFWSSFGQVFVKFGKPGGEAALRCPDLHGRAMSAAIYRCCRTAWPRFAILNLPSSIIAFRWKREIIIN
jgi:hypothetical protein